MGIIFSFQSGSISEPNRQSSGLDDWGSQLFGWTAGYLAGRSSVALRFGLPASASVPEILTHVYKMEGPKAALQLNGPLAWVIWDIKQEKLTVVGDRFGIHRFYYFYTGESFLLSDILTDLVQNLSFHPDLNLRSLIAHMAVEAPPVGETYYQAVHVLEPGSWLQVKNRELCTYRYWTPTLQPTLRFSSFSEYAEALRDKFFEVVRDHLPEGPAAVCITAGLDSNAIAASLNTVAPALPLYGVTFIAPDIPEANEGPFSALVAQKLNISLLTLPVNHYMPLSSPNGISTSRTTPIYEFYHEIWGGIYDLLRKNGIPTLFTGLSGDHLFGGDVNCYSDLLVTGHWWELAKQIRHHRTRSGQGLRSLLRNMIFSPLVNAYLPSRHQRREHPVPWVTPKGAALYGQVARSNLPLLPAGPPYLALPGRKRRLIALRDRLLPVWAEQHRLRAASFGIELRHPLLDHRLIEFALSLPTAQTFESGYQKTILRRAFKQHLPEMVTTMWERIYPTTILERGIRQNEHQKLLSLCSNMRLSELGLVDEARITQSVQSYLSEQTRSALFWHTLALEDWLRRWN